MSPIDDPKPEPSTARHIAIRKRVLQGCACLLTPGALVGVSLPAHADALSSDVVVTASSGRVTSVRVDKDLLMPTTGRVTSPFGMRTHPVTGIHKLHTGTDFAAPAGTPVLAAADGTITSAREAGAYGNRMVVDHGDVDGRHLETTYSHLSEFEVTVGQEVSVGDLIARVGNTGLSTGDHLHFEVHVDGLYSDPMDSLVTADELAAKTAPKERPAAEVAPQKPAEAPKPPAEPTPAEPAEEPAGPAQEALEANPSQPAEDAEDAPAEPVENAPDTPADQKPPRRAPVRVKPLEAVWAQLFEGPAPIDSGSLGQPRG